MLGRKIKWHDWALTWGGDDRHHKIVMAWITSGWTGGQTP